MITLLILLTVIATATVTISVGLLGLVVYLWKSRQRAHAALRVLSNGYESLLTEKAYWLARKQSRQPLYVNKGGDTIH